MTYAEVKALFQSILNRRDITPSQIDSFFNLSVQRIQRTLRVPAMEILVSHTFTGLEAPAGQLPIPGDFLELISISQNDASAQTKLIKGTLRDTQVLARNEGIPQMFHRQGSSFILGPRPTVGVTMYLNYYEDAASLVNPSDSNWLTEVSPDLLTYGALSFAADTFLDERAVTWEARYQGILQELKDQAVADETTNASIARTYDFEPFVN